MSDLKHGRWYYFETGREFPDKESAARAWNHAVVPSAIGWTDYIQGTAVAEGGECLLPPERCRCNRVWTYWQTENQTPARPIHSLVFEAARDSLGIYPQSIRRAGVQVERTPWQDGWNAAIFAMLEASAVLHAWYAELTPEQADALLVLLRADAAFFSLNAATIKCYLIMNDTFGYAEANAVELRLGDIPFVAELWRLFEWHGLTAWASLISGDDVITEHKTDQYAAALAYIKQHRLVL